MQLKHYAKFSLAHKLISFYKSVGCLIVHHCIGKSQLVRTGTSWKNIEHFTDILNSEVGSWGKTVENPRQAKTAYAETPLHQEALVTQECCLQTAFFNPPLINQCEIQSDLKESFTLTLSDHLPAPIFIYCEKFKALPCVAHSRSTGGQ